MTPPTARRRRGACLAVVVASFVLGGPPAQATAQPAARRDQAIDYSNGHPPQRPSDDPVTATHHRSVHRGVPRLTHDAPGTRIQNRGIAAAPYGPRGGIGPGGIGNYQVTAHRSLARRDLRADPDAAQRPAVYVDAGPWRYVYRIVDTRWVYFRSPRSLRAQRAPVPGQARQDPDEGVNITISTCATPEDHAAGNYWTDRFGNPEHRIDKIGVLVTRIARPPAD